jgi:DNA-binding Lrp family transcriptional regulator
MIVYILINCIPSEEKGVITDLSKLPELVEVNGVMGKYDIFTKVVGKVPGDIDLALMKIRSIKGITNTYTMTALYGQGGTIDKESSNQ